MSKEYELRGNPIIADIPQIDNHRYDEARKEILAKHNERFKENPNIADNNKYRKGQPLTHSNTPRALSYEQRAKELGLREFHVLSPKEVVIYWPVLPEKEETYADTNSIAVFPRPSDSRDNETSRKKVLDILGMKKTEIPLVVSGLDVEPAGNSYGFTFIETESTKSEEAPYLVRDGRISYNGTELIQSEEGIPVWVPDNQSGFLGLCRYWSDRLDARSDDLLGSGVSGRVQIFYDPQGRAENLEGRLRGLQEDRIRQIADPEYLKTGRF